MTDPFRHMSQSEREDRRRQALLHGLLDEAHGSDYNTSAYFRAAIDMLVSLLPAWVDGIAKQAAQHDAEFRERVELAKRTIPSMVITEDMLDSMRGIVAERASLGATDGEATDG